MTSTDINRFYTSTIHPKYLHDYQRHHLIPVQVFRKASLKKYLYMQNTVVSIREISGLMAYICHRQRMRH